MARIEDFLKSQFENDPKEEVGIGGFTALARISERFKKSAQVPTAFLEDGSYSNDQIIKDPIVVTIRGEVGDVHVRPSPPAQTFRRAQAELGNITQYAPDRTTAELSRVSAVANGLADVRQAADAVIDAGTQALDYLGVLDRVERDLTDQFLDAMGAVYDSGQLIAIDLISKRYENMALTLIDVERNNESKALRFVIEAQQLRFSETIFTERDPAFSLDGQVDPRADKGTQEGEKVERSFLSYGADTIKSIFGGD